MTMMREASSIFLALAAGLVLGVAFFGGLWWTVARVTSGRGAAWLLPLSSLVRTALVLAGFWLVAQGQPLRLAACVGGWLLARWFMIRRFGPRGAAAQKGDTSCT